MITNKSKWLLAGLLYLTFWLGVDQGQFPALDDANNWYMEVYAQGPYQWTASDLGKDIGTGAA